MRRDGNGERGRERSSGRGNLERGNQRDVCRGMESKREGEGETEGEW